MSLIARVASLHSSVFTGIERFLESWFLGLGARLVFAGVLFHYYFNSAKTKVGSGIPDMFVPQVGAYAQILPKTTESVGYDVSQIAFIPYGLIVLAGTYSEFILPVLIVLGLFTRLASLGMIGFIVVQSYVDITAHGLDAKTVGSWFDVDSASLIADQRALWIFLLAFLVVKGGGLFSLDRLLGARARPSSSAW